MLNLEQAIAEWRQRMQAAGIASPEPLEELESHLRDEIEQQVKAGLSELVAFELAVRRIGQPPALNREFKRIRPAPAEWWRKLKGRIFGVPEIPLPALEAFAPSARDTLAIAPAEARRFHHDFIGTEHILLGLLQAQSTVLAGVMRRLGMSSEGIRREIELMVGVDGRHTVPENIPYTPRARKALQLAVSEAKTLNQPEVRAEHLFLGLLHEGSGVASLVLKNLGVQVKQTRLELLNELRANPGTGPTIN